jgi:hypothetical protein
VFFLLATVAGAFSDGVVSAGEILGLDSLSFSFP